MRLKIKANAGIDAYDIFTQILGFDPDNAPPVNITLNHAHGIVEARGLTAADITKIRARPEYERDL